MCSPSLLLSSRGRRPRLGAILLQLLALLLGTAGAGPLVAAGLGSGLGPLGRARPGLGFGSGPGLGLGSTLVPWLRSRPGFRVLSLALGP